MYKKRHIAFLIIVILITVFVFAYLIQKVYSVTINDAKKNHQTQQLQMAKVVSSGINFFMDHMVKDMQLLIENANLNQNNYSTLKNLIHKFRQQYDQAIINSIVLTDSARRISYSTGENLPVWIDSELEKILPGYYKSDQDLNFILSEILPKIPDDFTSEKLFLVVLPVNKPSNTEIKNGTLFVVFVVNFDSFIEHFIIPLELSNSDFVWILDGSGRLIYHPKHEEMLFNSIFDEDHKCLSCHTSFTNQKKMLEAKKPSFGETSIIGDEPSKIFAYAPISIANQKWFIAISTTMPDVTAGLKDRFQIFFLLGVIILFTFLVFIFLIYFLNLKRIKSEEIRKNLEKIQEYQEQLNHSSRLASIGELVDSVAHEINTPIGIISAHADSILLQEKSDSLPIEELEIIKKQTKRVGDYIKSLLSFSKRIAFNPENLVANDLIDESIYLLQPRFREKNIKLIKEYPQKSITVFGDKRQLEQVLINLFNNAIDSINSDGKIVVKISEQELVQSKLHKDKLSKFVLISITDNGSGIKPEFMDKIFEPFFTSKEKSGTGLGLSIAKGIISRHRGKIEVESKVNEGTTFTLIIPKNFEELNKNEK